MREFPRYCALILAVTLCLFSGGLPIVIASCPMMNSTKALLPRAGYGRQACDSPPGGPVVLQDDAGSRAQHDRNFSGGRKTHNIFPVFTELLFLPSSSTCNPSCSDIFTLDKQSHSPPLAQLIVSSSILVI